MLRMPQFCCSILLTLLLFVESKRIKYIITNYMIKVQNYLSVAN